MIEDIVIVGAGGLGREVEWLINRINKQEKKFNILGFLDDNKDADLKSSKLKVISNIDGISDLEDNVNIVVAIANAKVRKAIVEKINSIKKVKFPNIIDPSAVVDENMIIGEGNIICVSAILTVDIEMNNFNIINANCTIGHDAKLCNYVTLYPNVNVSGNVLVNDCVEIGTGTQIIQGKTIGRNSIIGAGSVVIRDIESDVTAVGVPTRILQK